TKERHQVLEDLAQAMEEATEQHEHDLYYDLNLQFHDRILEYCNNRHAAQAYETYVNELHFFRRRFFNYTSKMQRSNKEHREILAAIVAGDAVKAGELAEQHVLAGKQRLIENMGDLERF